MIRTSHRIIAKAYYDSNLFANRNENVMKGTPNCRCDYRPSGSLILRHHCPSSMFVSSFSILPTRRIISTRSGMSYYILLPLYIHSSFRGLSDFSNVTASKRIMKFAMARDNHLAEEISRVYYLRSTVTSPLTIRFYTISSYTSYRQADP